MNTNFLRIFNYLIPLYVLCGHCNWRPVRLRSGRAFYWLLTIYSAFFAFLELFLAKFKQCFSVSISVWIYFCVNWCFLCLFPFDRLRTGVALRTLSGNFILLFSIAYLLFFRFLVGQAATLHIMDVFTRYAERSTQNEKSNGDFFRISLIPGIILV